MSKQLTLWAHSKTRDPLSSHRAGDAIRHDRILETQNNATLAAVKKHNGSTSKELAAVYHLDRHMVARRLPGLRTMGKVRNCFDNAKHCKVCTQGTSIADCEYANMRICTVGGRLSITWWIHER